MWRDHLSTNCLRKKNLYNAKRMLLKRTNEEIVEIDEEIYDTETIYSIISIKEGQNLNIFQFFPFLSLFLRKVIKKFIIFSLIFW